MKKRLPVDAANPGIKDLWTLWGEFSELRNEIGGDIASDRSGRVHQVWSNFGNRTIQANNSTDGGVSFGPRTTVASVNAEFNFFIPCFDDRGAPIIISVSADTTSGPYADRVYACWADTHAPPVSNPTNNHARICFAYSADQGATWSSSNPHSLDDILSVDRFNPWMDLDESGHVHLVYYSTQNDPGRLKPDLYDVMSCDGGETWGDPIRITSISSNYINDSFQWGDYNGLSIVDGEIRPIWTDNRSSVRSFTADMSTGASPDFSITLSHAQQTVCVGQFLETITLDLSPIDGYGQTVTASFRDLPAGFFGSFANNPAAVPAQILVELSTNDQVAEGATDIVIDVTDGVITHDISLDVFVRTQTAVQAGELWRAAPRYIPQYDFDGDGVINCLDLLMLDDCQNP